MAVAITIGVIIFIALILLGTAGLMRVASESDRREEIIHNRRMAQALRAVDRGANVDDSTKSE